MGQKLTPIMRLAEEGGRKKLTALSNKELRKLFFRQRAGLAPVERIGVRKEAILIAKILAERKGDKRRSKNG